MQGSTARTVALLAAAGIVIGAIGPWQTTFLVDIAGTKGDGRVTLLLGLVAGILVLLREPGSRWLLLAVVLGVACTIVGVSDLVTVSNSTEEIYGREVDLISPGWGLWLTAVASAVFTVSAYMFKTEAPHLQNAPPDQPA